MKFLPSSSGDHFFLVIKTHVWKPKKKKKKFLVHTIPKKTTITNDMMLNYVAIHTDEELRNLMIIIIRLSYSLQTEKYSSILLYLIRMTIISKIFFFFKNIDWLANNHQDDNLVSFLKCTIFILMIINKDNKSKSSKSDKKCQLFWLSHNRFSLLIRKIYLKKRFSS